MVLRSGDDRLEHLSEVDVRDRSAMHEDSTLPVVEMSVLLLVACHHLDSGRFLLDLGFLRLHVFVLEVGPDLLELDHCSAPVTWVVHCCHRPGLNHEGAGAGKYLGRGWLLASSLLGDLRGGELRAD